MVSRATTWAGLASHLMITTLERVLFVLGASHHDADLATVEALCDSEQSTLAVRALTLEESSPLAGAVVLSTCNRFEVYGESRRFHDAVESTITALATATSQPRDRVAAMLRLRTESDAVEHLFRVAAGLDSMVVGEAQIAGQVSDALLDAQAAGTATSLLNLVFQSAARTAKRVANETGLRASGRSIAAAALDLAERHTAPGDPGRAVLIGTGAYAGVVTAEFRRRGYEDLAVYSPSGRADAFARSHGLTAITPERLVGRLTTCSLVVSCSGTGTVVLHEELVETALTLRGRDLPIVDLALQPDVPPSVRGLPGVRLIDLVTVADSAEKSSDPEVDAATRIVEDAVAAMGEELADRELAPAIVALRRHVTETIEREVERLLPRIPEEAAPEVRHAAHRLARALLHVPSAQAHEVARSGSASEYVRALHILFGIELSR